MTGSHHMEMFPSFSDLNEYYLAFLACNVMDEFPQLTMGMIEQMMRRISLRAGVVILSNEVYSLARRKALGTIMAIITPAHEQSMKLHAYRRECNKKTVLGSHQSIRDVAPFPYYSVDDDGDETDESNFVLVPKQLEDVTFLPSTSALYSSQLLWHARGYGDGWHVAIDSARKEDIIEAQDQAILSAQEMYDFSQDGDNDVVTDDDDMILPQTDEDAIILIVQDRLWFDDSALVAEALNSLNKLVYSNTNLAFENNRKIAIRQGAPLVIVQAMRQNEESGQIQFYACKALANIALCQLDHTRQDIIESCGVKACIRALTRFWNRRDVQLAGCNMIGNLWLSPDVRKAVADGGGLQAVTDAMKNHKLQGCMQEYGCYALFAQLHCESSWAEATVNVGCIEAFIYAMENFRDNAQLQRFGCQFLCALAKSHGTYYNRITTAKGLVAVVEALRIHNDNATVVRAAEKANRAILDAAPTSNSTT